MVDRSRGTTDDSVESRADGVHASMTWALELFQRTAATVPAYRTFLAEHRVEPQLVRNAEDFHRLPRMTKADYVRAFPLDQTCRDGRLATCDLIAVSSGSSGSPTFWPRGQADQVAVTAAFERIFQGSFQADRRTTLAVVCFPLGTWVGGLYTVDCCRELARGGYPITTVAVGNNLDEVLRVVPELARYVDQVVLLGYPPFVRNVLDTGIARGLDWSRYRTKVVLGGELFSEDWRDLVMTRTGATSPCFDTASLYGSADAGLLGIETPLTVAIRRFFASRPAIAAEFFGESRIPSLVQYDPAERFFERDNDGTLTITADTGVPLIRYHIADEGALTSYADMMAFCAQHGFDPLDSLRKDTGFVAERGVWDLPFLHVFGRSLFTVSYFGANIYPETVAAGLEDPEVASQLTGAFLVETIEDDNRERQLVVTAELAPEALPSVALERRIAESVLSQLTKQNSEFVNYVPADRKTPNISLRTAGDPIFASHGVKSRYVPVDKDREERHG